MSSIRPIRCTLCRGLCILCVLYVYVYFMACTPCYEKWPVV